MSASAHVPTLLAAGVLVLAAAPAAPPASAAAAAGKTTVFTGRIVAGTGKFGLLRGAVRLVLRAGAPVGAKPLSSSASFTLDVSAPACAGQKLSAPRYRCVALSGRVTGTAHGSRANPDVGATFMLAGAGTVGPLGKVAADGTTRGVGFIAHGRFPLTLSLRTAAGGFTISALGPIVPGFSAPF